MYSQGVFIITVLVYLTSGHPFDDQRLSVNCSSYYDVYSYEWECRNDREEGSLFHMVNQYNKKDWTGDDLKAGLLEACRLHPPSSLQAYIDCTMQLADECPSLVSEVRLAVSKKVSTFCVNGKISPWLEEVLTVPINFDRSCVGNFVDVPDVDCIQPIYEWVPSNLTFVTRISEDIVTRAYGCFKEGLVAMAPPTDPTQCTSTWQELTFGIMLVVTAKSGPGVGLPENVKDAMGQDLLNRYARDIYV